MSAARAAGARRWRAVLFDLDGTLTDPKPGITRSIQYALRKRGIEPPGADALEPFIGPPLETSFREAFGFDAVEARRTLHDYREYFAERGMYENAVYAGVPELLRALGDSGRQVGLATSKPTVYAQRILEHFDLAPHFDRVVGSFLDGRRGEKVELVAAALESFADVPPEGVVMVGDRRHDVHGARANGIDAIGVTWGYGSREELCAESPTSLAESVDELGRLLLVV